MRHFSTKKFFFIYALILIGFFHSAFGQVLTQVNDKAIGGNGLEYLVKCIKTKDGGNVLVGFTNAANGDVAGPSYGNFDYWLVKTDARGEIEWSRMFGSAANEYVYDVTEDLLNGGFILIGYTEERGVSGNISTLSKGGPTDIWIVKVSGNGRQLLWEKRLGGNNQDYGISISQTPNGNYLIAGFTSSASNSGDLGDNPARGDFDYWLISIDATGTVLWDKRLGGRGFEGTGMDGGSMQAIQTTDGGYIIAGRSFSGASGDKSENSHGSSDIWIVKLNADLSIQWDITLGGTNQEIFTSIEETSEGGYIIGGTSIADDPVLGSFQNKDYWIIKLNALGSVEWEQNYGGNLDDELTSVLRTSDGGYLLGGFSLSGISGEKSQANFGSSDFWAVKITESGTKEWDAAFGGVEAEYLAGTVETSEGGYLLAGSSFSAISGSKTAASKGASDFWLVRLQDSPLPIDLVSFQARITTYNDIELSWTTASEINNALFIIERSKDAISFDEILHTIGAGNSSQPRTYFAIDEDPVFGEAYYRLKQVDIDGNFTYSKTISIHLDQELSALITIFPNPARSSELYLSSIEALPDTDFILILDDILGNRVIEKNIHLQSNKVINLFDKSPIVRPGVYIITIVTAKDSFSKKIVITN